MRVDRNIESYVKYYDLLSKEECETAVKEIENFDWREHTFYNPSDKTIVSYDRELSVSNENCPSKTLITQKIWYAIRQYIVDDHRGFAEWYTGWNGYTLPRFNKYAENTQMKLHCDHIHSMFDGERKGVPILTVLGALNDDYEGGELVLWTDTPIQLKAGKVMIFPSNFMYPHEVKLVTKGTRYSYVSWVW